MFLLGKLREVNVFSRHSVHGGRSGIPCDHYSRCIGPHHAGIPPVQGPTDCIPWTCSNLFIMKHVQLASGRLASCWNAFLLSPAKKLLQGSVFTRVCDSVHREVSVPACTTGHMTRGSLSRGVSIQGGISVWGVSVQGVSVWRVSIWGRCLCPGGVSVKGMEGLCPGDGGSLSRGMSLSRGRLCPGGLCPEGSLCRGVSVQGVSVQGGLCQGGSLSRG